ncbi:NUDIX domain-containing protein [Candidatus Woesebacteria bacterium]|nr:NUDIX domain-containing protein [Candidatus Woesebacteria bacterium]
MLKRSSNATSRPDCWDLPGGNSEWPSRTDNASNLHTADIIREVKEETGVQLTADAFGLSNISLMRTFFEAERQVYSVILGWKIMISSKPSVILSHEHTAFEWVTIGAIDQYDFGGSKGDWLKEVVVESRAISR